LKLQIKPSTRKKSADKQTLSPVKTNRSNRLNKTKELLSLPVKGDALMGYG